MNNLGKSGIRSPFLREISTLAGLIVLNPNYDWRIIEHYAEPIR